MDPQNTLVSPAPSLFGTVAWSWLILSAGGLLLNLLSLATLPSVESIQNILMPLNLWDSSYHDVFQKILAWAVPVTVGQIFLSAVATWASWAFLKRKNWGRIILAILNWILTALVGLLMAGSFYLIKMICLVSPEDLKAAGLGPALPVIVGGFLALCTILLLAPLVWMGWYFHSSAIKNYCHKKQL